MEHHVIDVAHVAQERATPRLKTIPRSFELRAHVYASLAHTSAYPGHTHCERFVRDIGRFCGGQSLLARACDSQCPGGASGGAGQWLPGARS